MSLVRPMFSVCIPSYDREAYIGETIASVLAQECQDFEIIVSDDASPDGTIERIESFRDPRITVRKNTVNLGQSCNSQRATEIARGEFISMLDSDDLMRPHALSTYCRIIDDVVLRGLGCRNSLLLTSQMRDIDEQGRDLETFHGSRGYYARLTKDTGALVGTFELGDITYEIYDAEKMLRYLVRQSMPAGAISTMAFSRSLYDKAGQINTMRIYSMDRAFAYKLLAQKPAYIHVVAPLYKYRLHPGNQHKFFVRVDARSVDDVISIYNTPGGVWETAGITREEFADLFTERKLGKTVSLIADGETARAAECLAFSVICRREIANSMRYRFYQSLLMSGPLGMILAKILRRLRQYRDSKRRSDENVTPTAVGL